VSATILAGPYRAVRIEPLKLAQDVRLRRWAKEQGKGQYEAIGLMALLWSWQAGRWRGDGPWGLALPSEAVDVLMGKGSSEAMVRVGLARWDASRPTMAIVMEPMRGAPRVTRGKRKGRRDRDVIAERKVA
jgi:hypothetical protein